MDESHVDSKPPRARRRLGWWLLGGLALLLVFAIALITGMILGRSVDRRLAEATAEADRDDPSWRLSDLLTHREPVPGAENSRLVMHEVVVRLPKDWLARPIPEPANVGSGPPRAEGAFQRLSETAANVRLDDATAQTLRSELETHKEGVRLARTVADYRRGRHDWQFPADLYQTLLPETQEARNVARLLEIDAAMRVHDGDADGAVDSCRAILGVARSIGDAPFSISQLVRQAIDNAAIRATRRVLGEGEPSEAALARVQALILDEQSQPLLLTALRGERALLHEMMRRFGAGALSLGTVAEQGPRSGSVRLSSIAPWGKLLFDYQRAIGLQWMNELVSIAQWPPAERHPLVKDLELRVDQVGQTRVGSMTAALPVSLVPGMVALFSANSRWQCEMGSMAILLAAARHRRTTGQWPASVAAIDPRILTSPPFDPFSGQLFRMKHRNRQLWIYSIGPDRKDEHGAYDPKQWMKGGPDDVGSSAWDVTLRRQSPLR